MFFGVVGVNILSIMQMINLDFPKPYTFPIYIFVIIRICECKKFAATPLALISCVYVCLIHINMYKYNVEHFHSFFTSFSLRYKYDKNLFYTLKLDFRNVCVVIEDISLCISVKVSYRSYNTVYRSACAYGVEII